MPVPTDREGFKDYCLRRLGYPVIEINVDDDQVEDRIDDALQYWRDYHFDALEHIYSTHTLTQQDITNQYLPIDPLIIGITRILPLSDASGTINMFDLRYQLRLNDLYDFTSSSYVNFTLTMQHLRTLEILFVGLDPIRFNRHQQKLFIDWGWGTTVNAGNTVIMECDRILDPDVYPDIWNDKWLKEYATALIKRQWGEQISKYAGVQLPGGVQLDGQRIFEAADREVRRLEENMIKDYSAPLGFDMN